MPRLAAPRARHCARRAPLWWLEWKLKALNRPAAGFVRRQAMDGGASERLEPAARWGVQRQVSANVVGVDGLWLVYTGIEPMGLDVRRAVQPLPPMAFCPSAGAAYLPIWRRAR